MGISCAETYHKNRASLPVRRCIDCDAAHASISTPLLGSPMMTVSDLRMLVRLLSLGAAAWVLPDTSWRPLRRAVMSRGQQEKERCWAGR